MSGGPGRWPTDRGFEEWYGPPRTHDDALWPTDPWYDPERDPITRMLEIRRGDSDVTEGDQLRLEVRRACDTEYLRRAEAFIRRTVDAGSPFFIYFNHSLLHFPVIPREEFAGKTGQGEFADSLLELDTDFGVLLDLLDELGLADDTIVVFAGDNRPDPILLWRGTAGYWEGSYFSGAEGNLRTRASCAGKKEIREFLVARRGCRPSGPPDAADMSATSASPHRVELDGEELFFSHAHLHGGRHPCGSTCRT